MKAIHLLILVAAALVACGEKPQIIEQSSEQAAKADQQESERRERTLRQGESGRIY